MLTIEFVTEKDRFTC